MAFEDVLIGEVWLASGQSNMEMGIGACRDGKEEIAAANGVPEFRQAEIQHCFSNPLRATFPSLGRGVA